MKSSRSLKLRRRRTWRRRPRRRSRSRSRSRSRTQRKRRTGSCRRVIVMQNNNKDKENDNYIHYMMQKLRGIEDELDYIRGIMGGNNAMSDDLVESFRKVAERLKSMSKISKYSGQRFATV